MIDTETCECGHSWWEHHWDSEYLEACNCFNCHCTLYTQAGTSCYWLVRLYYELEYLGIYKARPIIESWIGDEKRYERERTESK